jgi:hypothetical protein
VRLSRAYCLRVFLHRAQHDVIERVRLATAALLPDNRVSASPRRGTAVVVVTCYSQSWPDIFPQHGRGRKHLRAIVLEPWQEAIIHECPGDFIQGCIDTDGCRHRRIVNGKNYPAYSFSNRSEDILNLFAWGCDLVGVRWRRASRKHIDVTRRPDVARLDSLFGHRTDST